MKILRYFFISLLFASSLFNAFSQENQTEISSEQYEKYIITAVDFEITGQTKPSAINRTAPVDCKKIFNSKNELESYLNDYKQRLENLRAFDSINLELKEVPDENSIDDNSDSNIKTVRIKATLVDSKHFILLPYPKYSSNDGFTLKLKLKDDNFMGTLSPLEGEGKLNADSGDYKAGIGASYNFPFSAGPLEISFNNNHSILWTLGETVPDFNFNSGFTFTVPISNAAIKLDLLQSAIRGDDEHRLYDNTLFYAENAELSVPVSIPLNEGKSPITITPYTNFVYYWSNENINENDILLSSPILRGGAQLEFGRIDWKENYRNGITLKLDGNLGYDFNRSLYIPFGCLDFKGFKAAEHFGIASSFKFFAQNHMEDTIGCYLRGIPDTPEISSKKLSDRVLYVPSAMVLNLDIPFHLFSFKPSADSKLHSFGFEVQVSPFIDAALTQNDMTGRSFDPRDGWYSAGLEVLIYPFKWKSVVVRGSIGADLGKYVFDKFTGYDTSWRDNISGYEIFIGLGLAY